jgi:hypothetical protein
MLENIEHGFPARRELLKVSSAREDTSMNRIVATMAVLVDAGVCTHRQNLLARDRGSKRK